MLTAAISGHRPEKIDDMLWVKNKLRETFELNCVSYVIQGMAAGVDLAAAKVAYKMGLNYECAIPWQGHAPRVADKHDYDMAKKFADKITYVDPAEDYPGPWVYQKRNEYMVDNAGLLIAVWDGSPGGTRNCVVYAQKKNMPIFRIDPKTKTVHGIG